MVTVEASSKIAGYTFQFQRALYRLLASESPNAVIGVETDDDVVEMCPNSDGTIDITFEQDKHSVQISGQPYQNSSKNLWHTMHIWLHNMKTVRAKYKKVCYCLVTNKNVKPNAFASKLSSASDEKTVKDCIKEIRKYAAAATGKEAVHIKAVSKFADPDLQYLIENLRLMDDFGTVSGLSAKDAAIELLQLSPDLLTQGEQIYESLLGMIVQACQTAWLTQGEAWIDKAQITTRLQDEIHVRRMDKYLERPLLSTSFKQLLEAHPNEHLFLKQLDALGAPPFIRNDALQDYWGFYAERVRLRELGDVLPDHWDTRDQILYQRWKQIRNHAAWEGQQNGDSDEKVGQLVLKLTIDGNYVANLGPHQTSNPYFTSGNYQDLANRNDCEQFVFWHPSFEKKT